MASRCMSALMIASSARRCVPSTAAPAFVARRVPITSATLFPLRHTSTARLFSTEPNNANANSSTSTSTPNTDASSSSTDANKKATESAPATPDYAAQLAEKDAKLKDLNDKWMRALAEVENMRTRARNDVDNARKFAVQTFAKHMLEVADTLALAGKSAEDAVAKTQDPLLKSLHEGIVMTEKVLQKAFENNGVKRFDPIGQKFDPNLHDGLFEVDDPTKEPLTVAQVLKVGYTLNDRILRAANVGTVRARSS